MTGNNSLSAANRTIVHGLILSGYLDELVEIRTQADTDLCAAAERSLKTLDRFLGNIAAALGMRLTRPGMGDAIRYLEELGGLPQSIAARAEAFRGTRNALAHNPDLTLRPEAAARILDGVEKIIRLAAGSAYDMARRPPVTIGQSDQIVNARSLMLSRSFRQIVVVDHRGKLIDLLTYRDIVIVESMSDIDTDGVTISVQEAVSTRDYVATAPVARSHTFRDVVDALDDERLAAAVVTENGKLGETPLGIITRGDILRMR